MNETANQLSARVLSLRSAGHPSRAVILDALATFPVERLAVILENRILSEADVRLVVEKTGHHQLAVADVLRKFIQHDCADYQANYRHLTAGCRSVNANSLAEAGLAWLQGRGLVHFLLHDIICCWNSRDSRLGQGLVIENDRRYLLARCFLIVKHLAFPTTLDLLQCSREEGWTNWQGLWKYF